jgi:hypothetical protein
MSAIGFGPGYEQADADSEVACPWRLAGRYWPMVVSPAAPKQIQEAIEGLGMIREYYEFDCWHSGPRFP